MENLENHIKNTRNRHTLVALLYSLAHSEVEATKTQTIEKVQFAQFQGENLLKLQQLILYAVNIYNQTHAMQVGYADIVDSFADLQEYFAKDALRRAHLPT